MSTSIKWQNTAPTQWEWDMLAVDDAQVEVICPICNGAGTGTGCWEQGGFIAGLCSECHGYGKWQRNVDDAPNNRDNTSLIADDEQAAHIAD